MKEFYIPILPITLEKNTDQKLNDREVPGIELEYPWREYKSRSLFTGDQIAKITSNTKNNVLLYRTWFPSSQLKYILNTDEEHFSGKYHYREIYTKHSINEVYQNQQDELGTYCN